MPSPARNIEQGNYFQGMFFIPMFICLPISLSNSNYSTLPIVNICIKHLSILLKYGFNIYIEFIRLHLLDMPLTARNIEQGNYFQGMFFIPTFNRRPISLSNSNYSTLHIVKYLYRTSIYFIVVWI